MAPRTPHTGFRFTADILALIDRLAKRWGLTRTATLIILIKDRARQEGLEGPEDKAEQE